MPALTVLRVIVPFAIGYFISYLYRTVNAVIAPNLTDDLALDPASLGLLTSAYFLTFAAFQLPLGVLLDRFGPRRVESVLLLFAAVGAVLFAVGDGEPALVAGRALIGLGVSACLMAAFKAMVLWFPPERLPLVNGVIMAAGGMGALAATAPVEALLGVMDWRGLFWLLSAVTLAAAAGIFLAVPDAEDAHGAATPSLREQLGGVREVFTSARFWRIAPMTTLSQASFLSIQGLWTGPWMKDVAGFDRPAAANALLLIATAMVAGFLSMGVIAERLGRIGVPTLAVAGAGMVAFMAVQGAIILGAPVPVLGLWAAFGFFGTTGILPYAALSQSFPRHLAGRVNTSVNLLVFVTAFAGQWGIGAVIGLWPGAAAGAYAPEGYQAGFAMMLGLQLLAFTWLVAPRRSATASTSPGTR